MKFKQFQPNPFARSIYPRSQITMWGFAWHFQGLWNMPPEHCSTDSRSTRKDENKNEISDNIRGEGSVSVCVCVVCSERFVFRGERTRCCLPVRGSVFRWGTDAFGLPGAPVTCSRSLSSPMTAAVFQSMISEKGSSQPLLSITGTHAAWNTHTHTHTEWSLDVILHKHNHKRTAKWQIRHILILIIIKAAIWGSFLDWITIDQSSCSYPQKKKTLIW